MKPVLYNESYSSVIGVLNNCIECYTEEERNGTFSLTLCYPITDPLHNELLHGRVIQCRANDEQQNQYFRIYNTERTIKGLVYVHALHISFDLAYDYVSNIDIKNQSCEYALNSLFRSSQFSGHYRGYSDIINAQDYKIQNVNLVDAIAGTQGSIIDTFGTGAEIKRDNTNIYVYNKRGANTGVKIEYGVNLLDESLEVDISDLVTSIIGTASYTDANGDEHVVSTSRIDSPNVSNYPHPYILYKNYTDRFDAEEEITQDKIINLIEQDYSVNHVDQPKCSYTIDFVPLSKCSGYEDIEDNIHLCDTVRIIDSRYGIDTEAKVIKYKYNVLTERYETMELGNPRNTLNDVITGEPGKGEPGPPGPQGPPGEDGSIGDFPPSLPDTPILSGECYGFASIELSWTFESKVYYSYELYASKTRGFTPNTFDLIHEGQTSSFLYQARPNETWYFKVCGKNSYGDRTAFSNELKIDTYKIDDMTDYFSDLAIGNAVVGSLTADYMTAGVIKGHWIDAKNLSVTNGNGVRTLDIDSYGNVNLNVASLKISSSNVATEQYAEQQASAAQTNAQTNANNRLNNTIKNYYTKTQTDSKISVLNDSISLKASKTEVTEAIDKLETSSVNMFRYSNFERENILNYWTHTTQGGHYLTIDSYSGGKNLVDDKHIKGKKVLNSRINIKESISSNSKYSSFNLGSSYRSITLEANQEYTLSYWVYLGGNSKSVHATIWSLPQDGSTGQAVGTTESTTTYTGCFVRKTLTFTTSSESEYYIRFYHYYKNSLTSGESVIHIYQPMLSKGNKVVDWSESPLDIEEFTGEYIDKQIKDTKAEIEITTDSISQNVSSLTKTVSNKADNKTVTNLSNKVATIETNVNNVTTRVSSAEEKITETNEKALKNYNNLLINSNIKNGTQGWRLTNLELKKSLYQSTTTATSPPDRHTIIIGDNSDNTAQTRTMDSTKFVVQAGEKISLSYYIMSNTYVNSGRVYILFTDNTKPIEEDNTFFNGFTYTGVSGYNSWTKKTETVTVPTGATRAFIRIRYQSLEKPTTSDTNRIGLASLMVSRGEDYPTWTSNTEDSYYVHEERLSYAEQKITDDAITNTVKKNFYTKTETENSITEKGYQTSSDVQQTVDKLELKFQQSGGYNLLYNGDFKRGTTQWSISNEFNISIGNGNYSSPDRRGICILGKSGTTGFINQIISSEYHNSYNYTLSGNVYISSSGTDDSRGAAFYYYVRLSYDDGTYTYHRCEWDKTKYDKWQFVSLSFNRDTSKTLTEIRVTLSIQNSTRKIYLSQAMLEIGTTSTGWSPNPNEVSDGIVTIDKDGLQVMSSNSNTQTQMTSNGFYINNAGTNVLKVDGNGLVLDQGNVSITKGGLILKSPTGDIQTQTSNNGFYITQGGTNVFYANANGVSLANGNVSMNANGVSVKSPEVSTQTFMNANGFNIKNGDAYVFTVNNDGIKLAQGQVIIDKNKVRVNHSDGSYSQMTANGFMRYVGGSNKYYHYLVSTGTVNVRDGQDATVQLPSEFKGKNFHVTVSAFKVNIINGWKGIYDIDALVRSYDRPNGKFTIGGMVNDVDGLEGTLDVSYIVIA